MKISSDGIQNGWIDERYGKHGTQFHDGKPSLSLPLKIEGAPKNTVTFALVLEDKDAYPVSGGFVWIHWLAANIKKTELAENASREAKDFVQGANSNMSIQGGGLSREAATCYTGMGPPDQPHLYELHVYALDTALSLQNGFYLNELFKQMDGHILQQATLKGLYRD